MDDFARLQSSLHLDKRLLTDTRYTDDMKLISLISETVYKRTWKCLQEIESKLGQVRMTNRITS